METFNFTHCGLVAYVLLFTGVQNASSLRQRIIAAATAESSDEREALNFAFLNARLITSRLHLQTAIYQAIISQSQGSLRTKTVHSEIIWALNPSNNISEAIRRYGVSESSTDLLVVRIDDPKESMDGIQKLMTAAVSGQTAALDKLQDITDWSTIKKYNKLNSEPAITSIKNDTIREKCLIDNIVTSVVAMKSVAQ